MHNIKDIRKDFTLFAKLLEKRSLKIDFEKPPNLDQRPNVLFVILAFNRIRGIFLFFKDLNILGQISDSKKMEIFGLQ